MGGYAQEYLVRMGSQGRDMSTRIGTFLLVFICVGHVHALYEVTTEYGYALTDDCPGATCFIHVDGQGTNARFVSPTSTVAQTFCWLWRKMVVR
jgi:hypothetical protein